MNVWAFAGLYGGLLCAAIAVIVGRHMAKKKRGLDERYEEIDKRSRVASWWLTFISMVILFTLVILEWLTSAAMVLGILYLIHLAGYSLFMVYYERKL